MNSIKFDRMNSEIVKIIQNAETNLEIVFKEREKIRFNNQCKVLRAFQEHRLAATDFHWSTGYGYSDVGREKIEKVYANIFRGEDALVRPSIASGTHALALTMQGILLPGDEMLYISGSPYDTMRTVIGLTKNEPGNLLELGIRYNEISLRRDQSLDIEKILNAIQDRTKLVVLQRSSGYSLRPAISIREMEEVFAKIKHFFPNVIIMVDNCYGEFTEEREPLEVGADIIAGSLIKNPGGGVAPGGGYVVGKEKLIQRVANRLTAPGIGKECGLMYDTTRLLFQGISFAPQVVHEAVKGAMLFSAIFEFLGYETLPKSQEHRSDIITIIKLETEDKVIQFCQSIQKASAVDAHVVPMPWDMPGYDHKIIMAAGGIIEGSSIELSADGPIREPYAVFYQGGLNYDQCKLAAYMVLEDFYQRGWF